MQQRRFAPTFLRAAGRPHPGARPRGSCSANAFALAVAALAALALWVSTARAQDPSAGPPATVPLVTAPAGGWSAWTRVAGPSFLSPSVAFNPVAGTLELAAVGLDLSVSHTRVAGSAASPPVPTGRLSFMPPVILVDAAGTPQLFVTGTDGAVTHSQFLNGKWSAPLATGAGSFLPPAAALNSAGNSLELITVGTDGGVRHSRFAGSAWSTPAPLNAVSFLPPALAANPAGGLELAIVGLDRQVYHARFTGSQWTAIAPTGVLTDVPPALAVSADGVVHLGATGLDRQVVHSRLVNNAWTAPVPTGIQSSLSPALAFSPGGSSLELLARGLDRAVQHGRFINGSWIAPVSLGITTDARPALAAAAGTALGAAVTAVDGWVYVSLFAGAAAPPNPAPATSPSFSHDIVRIFTSNGPKTCARVGCHGGANPQRGQNLDAASAYASIVNVPSVEKPSLLRVKPGDAANSYLFQKITGAPGIAGSRMPLAGGPLAAGDIALIQQWINAGAPNN